MKICPRCESKNIRWLNPQNSIVWECKDCGYTGSVIIEKNKKQLSDIKIIRKL